MSFYRGMTCENVTIKGDQGTPVGAYVAKPSGAGPLPGVVLIHHLPGWSEFYIETTRRFAHHGYLAICANLYERAGEGHPDDVAAKVRAEGGIPDAQIVGDTEAAVKWMREQPNHNGKVGLFGSCSGGRHAFLYWSGLSLSTRTTGGLIVCSLPSTAIWVGKSRLNGSFRWLTKIDRG